MSKTVKVILWDEEIGRLSWDGRRNVSYFTFNPDFLRKGLDVAPLTASVHDLRSRMPIYGDTERIYQKLPPFIADSLPDDWGNRLFDYWRKQHKITTANVTPLEKLSFIGRRGMGALEFMPESEGYAADGKVDIKSLIDLAQRIFTEREEVSIQPDESLTMQALIAVGTSAGGRQPKAIIAVNPATGEIRSGQVPGLDGFDYCILKFGDDARSSAELEMAYYRMAVDSGISMAESRLLEVEGRRHFLTRRFDRKDGGKLHVQTLAAIYPGVHSYEELLMVCRKLDLPEKDSEEVFRRLVFNILANNTDDHNKNFSFTMDRQGRWRLSPAYDMTFIFNSGGYQPEGGHCMSVDGKTSGMTKQDILSFASGNGIRRPEAIINKVVEALKTFRTLADECGVKDEWAGRVASCIDRHLAEWGYLQENNGVAAFTDRQGNTVSNVRIEEAYRGNYHLFANVNGKERKYVIRKGTDEYLTISRYGTLDVPQEYLRTSVEKFIVKSKNEKWEV